MPSRACTIASSRVIASTAPFDAVSKASWNHIKKVLLDLSAPELTRKLRRRGAHKRDEACGVDDASAGVQALRGVRRIVAHRQDCVLAAPPDAFDVDGHRQVPDALLRVECVVIGGVHDARIVKLRL